MAFLIIVGMLILSCWSLLATFKRLQRNRAGKTWWLAFTALIIIGLTAGWWLAFHFEYKVSPRTRYHSFPLPLAFDHLEGGDWVDFITPPEVMYPGIVANIVAVIAATSLPLLLVLGFVSKRHQMQSRPAPVS